MEITSFPGPLQDAIDDALNTIRTDPRHHYGPLRRRSLYAALRSAAEDEAVARNVRGRLAIITARRVQPLFIQAIAALIGREKAREAFIADVEMAVEDERMRDRVLGLLDFVDSNPAYLRDQGTVLNRVFAEDDEDVRETMRDRLPFIASLPAWLIVVAEGVVTGEFTEESDEAGLVLDLAHTAFGHALDYCSLPVLCAAQATHSMLYETLGRDPLDGLGYSLIRGNTGRYVPVTEWTDEQLARFGGWSIDTAAYGAMAYAGSLTDYSADCDPQRLEEFWTWWLTDALPTAWAATVQPR